MRIRSIKPGFWRSQDVADLSREHRLLWLGLWSYVDDNGVGIDDFRAIAADLFALDDDPNEAREFVREGLATLSRHSRITRYRVAGRPYLHITGWHHQRIDKPGKPRYPLPEDGTPHDPDDDKTAGHGDSAHTDTTEFAKPSRDSRETLAPGTEEQGNRGTGENTSVTRSASDEAFDAFWRLYPRKVGKTAAQRAFAKALKTTTAERILEALTTFARQRAGQDPQYTPHPSTWLNAGRWDDQDTPTTNRPASTGSARADKARGFLAPNDPLLAQWGATDDIPPPEAPLGGFSPLIIEGGMSA